MFENLITPTNIRCRTQHPNNQFAGLLHTTGFLPPKTPLQWQLYALPSRLQEDATSVHSPVRYPLHRQQSRHPIQRTSLAELLQSEHLDHVSQQFRNPYVGEKQQQSVRTKIVNKSKLLLSIFLQYSRDFLKNYNPQLINKIAFKVRVKWRKIINSKATLFRIKLRNT